MDPHTFRVCIFQLQKTLHKVNFTNFLKLEPDPHYEKYLDPDPLKMIAYPKHCIILFTVSVAKPKSVFLAGAEAPNVNTVFVLLFTALSKASETK